MAARARTALREVLRRSSGRDRLERTRRKGLRSSQLDQSETDRDRFDSMRHSGLGDTDGGGDREDDIVVVPVIEEPGPDPRRVRRARMSQGGQGKQDAQQQEDQGAPACHGRGRYSRRGRRATRTGPAGGASARCWLMAPSRLAYWAVLFVRAAVPQRISAASASSFGSTTSRESDGRPKIACSTPAAASASSPGFLGGAKKIDTGAVFGSRPAFFRRSRSSGIRSMGFLLGRMIGIQPSPNSTTRSNVVSPSPPMRIGGCGLCIGLGSAQILSKLTKSPWNSGSFLVQISYMASTRSRSRRQRDFHAVPWFSISSAFQPPPMPNSTRPPDRRSRVATSLAGAIGSRSMAGQMPGPSLSRLLAPPAAIRATNGS